MAHVLCKGVETLLFVLEMAVMNFNLDCLLVCVLHEEEKEKGKSVL